MASSPVVPTQSIGGSPFNIRKFNGNGFVVWRAQLQAYMQVRDCEDVLRIGRPSVATVEGEKLTQEKKKLIENWEDKNALARAILLLALEDDQALLVINLPTAKEMWDRLNSAHMQSSQASRVALQNQFFNCHMQSGERVLQYVARVQSLYSSMIQSGVKMQEENLVGRIVAGLPPTYHSFVTSWANLKDANQTIAELLPRLTNEESLILKYKSPSSQDTVNQVTTNAMISESRKGPQRRFNNNRRQSSRVPSSSGSSDGKSKEDWKKKMRCYNCNKYGHLSKECKKPNDKKVENTTEVVIAEGVVAEANHVVAVSAWILDSGASDHMSNDKSSFINYRELTSPRYVRFGDTGETTCNGLGDVPMKATVNGKLRPFLLKDVLYVPGIRRKLISIGAATSTGHKGEIVKDRIILRNKDDEIVLVGIKQGNLYQALAEEVQRIQVAQDLEAEGQEEEKNDSNLDLWHERLAHVSKTTIAKMKKFNCVEGLEGCSLEKDPKASDRRTINCESCCLAKHSRQPIPSSQRPKATEVAQVVHMDICGPIGTATLSGAKYFVLFKDEHSSYRLVYFVKSKEEVHNIIRRAVAQVRAETGKPVKCIQSDCGSEMTSKRTQEFFTEQGILHRTSPPFTPQLNGFIERDNRTVMEAVRSMLFHYQLPEKLWGEAANSAVYILNRVMNVNSRNKTPFELYFGRKPRITHLRVFGATAFVKAQEKKRSGYQRKLDPRSQKLVMVGYDRDFCYRLYDPSTNKIIISREVIFDETKRVLQGEQQQNYGQLEELIQQLPNDQHQQALDEVEEEDIESNLTKSSGDSLEPRSYSEAVKSPDAAKWQQAMKEEYRSLLDNDTWSLEKPPSARRLVDCKWVYKIKRNIDGSVSRYKARLVAKGYTQRSGIDYQETFAPVVRLESVRLILSIVAKEDLDFVHFDVSTAFLYGKLDDDIWMTQPEGYVDNPELACHLKKSIYGLKQASRVWNTCFTTFLKDFNLEPLESDTCVMIGKVSGEMLICAIYVDDGLLCSSSPKLLNSVLSYLENRFKITKMEPKCFVGLEIARDRANRKLTISQTNYIRSVVERFGLDDSITCSTPFDIGVKLIKTGVADGPDSTIVDVPYREAIGCLMYAMVGSRPDIAYTVNLLARFCSEPRLPHWQAAKKVMRYINATDKLGITYDGSNDEGLTAFSDADFASCRDSRKSVSGILVKSYGGAIIWKSQKQATVAESTTEAEFIACSHTSREVVWARTFVEQLYKYSLPSPTTIFVDNQSAIRLVENNQIHSRIKHIDIRLMAVRQRVEKKVVKLKYIETEEQEADIMTKPIPLRRFNKLLAKIGILPVAIVMIAIVVIIPSDSFKLPIKITEDSNQPVKHLTVQMRNPCFQVLSAEELMRGEIVLNETGTMNSSIINFTKTMCQKVFTERVQLAFNDIAGCLPSGRDKRDLTAILSTASLIAQATVGVTNFIKGFSEDTTPVNKRDIIRQLSKQVDDSSKMVLQDKQEMRSESIHELEIVSETTKYHLEELREEVNQIPMLVWTGYHALHELYAGAANLRAIKQQCRRRRLATQELAEMIENRELAKFQPEETILDSVNVNKQDMEIEFVFRVNPEVEVQAKDLVVLLGVGTAFLLVVVMLVVNLEVITTLKKQRVESLAVSRRRNIEV